MINDQYHQSIGVRSLFLSDLPETVSVLVIDPRLKMVVRVWARLGLGLGLRLG